MDQSRNPNQNPRLWAWIAGASQGLGLAFAEVLAARDYNLVLIARRAHQLEAVAQQLRAAHSIEVVVLVLDLASDELEQTLRGQLTQTPVHVAIYNAAMAPMGDLVREDVRNLTHAVKVNVLGPVIWARLLGARMVEQDGGQMLFMSSLAGSQGSPRLSTYAGSKAFTNIFGESIWHELKQHNVNVLVCCAGAIRTPGYASVSSNDAPGTLDAHQVAAAALAHLGRGPRFVPGLINKLAAVIVGRWLPRRWAVATMNSATANLGSD
jgi:short-subunit dehydrogenase